ncbi:MAG: hypothetical protein RSD68_05270 [Oscillospiraceae bacterium]
MNSNEGKSKRTVGIVITIIAVIVTVVGIIFTIGMKNREQIPSSPEAAETAAPAASTTPTPKPEALPTREIAYNKYLISPLVEKYTAPNEELYKLVFDAVDNFETSVAVQNFAPTNEEVAKISEAVFDRSEFLYLESIAPSADGTAIQIKYRPEFTKETAMQSKEKFRKNVESLLHSEVLPTYSDLEAVLSLYTYLSKNSTYNTQAADVGAYGMMVNREGICTGYAYALRYLFDQLGIENHLAFSNDESHIWNIVKLGNSYYHIDATWENAADKSVQTLIHFGQDDATRKSLSGFDGWYTRVNSFQEKMPAPECTSAAFAFLGNADTAHVNFNDHAIEYVDFNGNKYSEDISKLS